MKEPEVFFQGINEKFSAARVVWAFPGYGEPKSFLINEASLVLRIKNVKERGGDSSQEELAFNALRSFLYEKESKE